MFFSKMFSGSGAIQMQGQAGGWLGSYGWSGATNSGENMSPDLAIGITSVQRAVTLLAESVAQLPCNVFRKNENGECEKLTGHPVQRVISVVPNDFMTPFQAHEYKQLGLGLRGNSFNLKEYSSSGELKSIYPLHPDRVQVMVSPVDRMPYYQVLDGNDGVSGVFPLRHIHHVRWIGDSPYVGMSPISLHRESLGIIAAGEKHTARVFGNGTRLSGVITRPREAPAIKDKSVIDEIRNEWKKKYASADNAGEVALLQEGMEFRSLSMSNADAQLIEARGYGVREVARIYGIPARMLGAEAQGVKASFEQEAMEFVSYCLLPWVKRHEEAMERDYLTDSERLSGVYIQFDITGLLRGDTKSRYAAYALARQWGWLSVNDIRRLENLPPIPGGDTYLQPLNMADGKTGIPIGSGEPTFQQISEIEKVLS